MSLRKKRGNDSCGLNKTQNERVVPTKRRSYNNLSKQSNNTVRIPIKLPK